MVSPSVLAIVLLAATPTVTLDLDSWRLLVAAAADPEPEAETPLEPYASRRDVRLVVHEDHVRVEVSWRIEPGDAAWFVEPLLGPAARPESVTWDGRRARAHALRRGYVVVEPLDGSVTVGAVATLEWDGVGVLPIHLLKAVRGNLRVEIPGRDLRAELVGWAVSAGDGRFWTGSDRLGLSLVPRKVPAPRPILLGEIATGVTYGDAVAQGQARVRVVPRRGTVDRIVIRHRGLGEDVRVDGPDVASARIDADRIVVELVRPRETVVEITLKWTRSLDDDPATEPIPILSLEGVVHTEAWLQVARTGDGEVLPRVRGTRAARTALPEWANGLVSGPVVASYGPEPARGGRVSLPRFQLDDGPPAVVEIADYAAAVSPQGRVLVRARYTVRSDRARFLHLVPPPGARLLAVRVDGRDTRPLRMDDGRWRLPLARSVASVGGLISFPVELAWLADGSAWMAQETRILHLPRIDAPIAVQRAVVHLPPGWRPTAGQRRDGRVPRFSRGHGARFGFARDDAGDEKLEQARALLSSAVQAWRGNRFDDLRRRLAALEALGARSDDIDLLRANLDLLDGNSTSGPARRVRGRARARATKDRLAYDRLRDEAKKARRRGRYDDAEAAATQALDLAARLGRLDPDGGVELRAQQQSLRQVRLGARSARMGLPPPLPSPAPAREDGPEWPEVSDPTTAPSTEGEVENDLLRLDPGRGGLSKFDYGDPAIDRWGRFGGLGMSGYGRGAGYYGSRGSGRARGGAGTAHVLGGVQAASRSVPIPRIGHAVLFQHSLLPADAESVLTLRARRASRGLP
jgi:tetratricopeptide (TPR) repeat protein